MGAEAKRYLQEHSIPQLFEGLITGLIYNKPEDPIEFLENAIGKVRQNPSLEYKWDLFVDEEVLQRYDDSFKSDLKTSTSEKPKKRTKSRTSTATSRQSERTNSRAPGGMARATAFSSNVDHPSRPSSVMLAAETARIPDVPVILFMGGPGGGKTRHAARVQEALDKFGLVHICMPDMIRAAIAKYQNSYAEWREAAQRYQRGELIPNNLALGLVKAEMGRHPDAKAFFLEGFPREARQVEDFEHEVRPVNMAMILDYDEATLRRHMESRGLDIEVIDAKIREFKLKTLPSAKYFDDQRLLHLIPGEETDQWIFERMKRLIQRAMELGVPVTTSKVASRIGSPQQQTVTNVAQAAAVAEAAAAVAAEGSMGGSRPATAEKGKKVTASKTATNAAQAEAAPTISAAADVSAPVSGPSRSISRASSKELPSETSNGKAVSSINGGKTESKPGTAKSESKPVTAKTESRAGTAKTETKPGTGRPGDSEMALANATPLVATEVHEMPKLSRATVETVAVVHASPVSPIPATEIAAVAEAPSQPSKTPKFHNLLVRTPLLSALPVTMGASNSRKSSGKLSRTASEASKASEASHQSVHSIKRESTTETMEDQKPNGESAEQNSPGAADETVVLRKDSVISRSTPGTPTAPAGTVGAQLAATAKPPSSQKSDSSAVNDRFPRGLPNNAPVVVLTGPPGSNKAELSKRVARKYDGFIYFSMGDLLQKEVQRNCDDELWQRIGKKMDAGEPVPGRICRELLYSALYEMGKASWGYVVEGYPRSQNQAVDFENQLGRLDLVILIDCTEQFCIESIKKRREDAGKDARPDDEPQVVIARLEMFKRNTLPMLKYFDDKGKLKVVVGDANVDKIFEDICTAIDNTVFIEENEAGRSLSSSKASHEEHKE